MQGFQYHVGRRADGFAQKYLKGIGTQRGAIRLRLAVAQCGMPMAFR
jgi:hypothetical protein